MSPSFHVSIPQPDGGMLPLDLAAGESLIFVGANGSGKTRLGVYLEDRIHPELVQRIAAQKSLELTDDFNIISTERAERALRWGTDRATHAGFKLGTRWNSKPATHLLSDFEALLQLLFADHNKTASKYLQEDKHNGPPPTTTLLRLKVIWEALLPHRRLNIDDASVRVQAHNSNSPAHYRGSDMSDGERAIFYFIGQSLLAPADGVIIVDEPEAHIHRAILSQLWDVLEKERPDCTFVYITHDVEFAATHTASSKYYIRSYSHEPQTWDIDQMPEDTGLPEPIVVEVLGSRRPILFVEGDRGSVDLAVYRSFYHQFTVIPRGSCETVIHSVLSFKANSTLHRVNVHGIVDSDQRDSQEVSYLEGQGIYVLPVAEIESILLLPNVFLALARSLACPDPDESLGALTAAVMRSASSDLDITSVRYSLRQIDRNLKRLGIKAKDLSSLQAEYVTQIATVDPVKIFGDFKNDLLTAINNNDLAGVLALYDNKGLLGTAAGILGIAGSKMLLEKVSHMLGHTSGAEIKKQLGLVLPSI